MLAVVKEHEGPGFAVKDVPMPEVREDDVLIRARSVGICGTDIPILAGTRVIPWPMIPGHEFAGDVAGVGSRVRGFKEGDRVTSCLVIGCGSCRYCVEGSECLCDNLVETGIHVDGAFAEYVRAPAKTVLKLKDGTSYDQGASIDPVASAYRTIRASGITTKDTVAIFGPGPIGLYAVQLAKLRGARCVISIGTGDDADRLSRALELGADYAIDSSACDVAGRVSEITGGAMADFVQDCTGAPSVVESALAIVKKRGTFAVTGLFHHPVEVNLGRVTRSEISVYGTICYTRNEFSECLDLVEDGRVRVGPVITHHFALRDMESAWEVIQRREAVKVILRP
ncbi:MAG: alcohol dehydrogenase catalytic domain-containing protein [Synergistaceae bacterium]|nr:alcohol dehydrogenase catalytic domain-containing protein [Synergistaceae bacterium]